MLRLKAFALTTLLAVAAGVAHGRVAIAAEPERKVEADLIAPVSAIRAGKTFTVGLRQRITPNWHTYWKNPGDSGEPTRLTWQLPEGFTASEIHWPVPEAIPVGPLMNYGYSDQLLLPVTITAPATLDRPSVTLTAKAEWLVCEKICIPEEKTVSLTLPVAGGDATIAPSAHATLFEEMQRALPVDLGWRASIADAGEHLRLTVNASGLDPSNLTEVRYFPEAWGLIENAAPQKIAWTPDGVTLTLKRGDLKRDEVPRLTGVLALTERLAGGEVRHGFRINAEPVSSAMAALPAVPLSQADASGGTGTPSAGGLGFWQALMFAVIGGLILNLMPCVLPILSLKVMALASHGGGGSAAAARGGFAYLVGVMVSFAVLAGVLLALRGAGEALGWGFQFQSPVFVLMMCALFLALALSMSGVFEIGGSIVGVGEGLTRRAGSAGSFFTGVLATIAATPCTAPFMGAAIGFALTRPALETVVVLQALGLGFALPIFALSVSGAARRLLPKPGPWMNTLKQLLAFPLYATVAWLVWVLSVQSGSEGVLAAAFVLVGVGFGAWLLGRAAFAPLRFAAAGAAVVLAFGLALAQLGVTTAQEGPAPRAAASDSPQDEAFNERRLADLRAQGRPVFVNLTAAWCITCKVNERVALQSDGFRAALKRHNAVYLKGDWTNRDDAITRVLQSFGRAGVPLYVLYPADPRAEPIVLPQILTEAIVVRHFAAL